MGLVKDIKNRRDEIIGGDITEEEFNLAMAFMGERLYVDPMEQDVPTINEDGEYI